MIIDEYFASLRLKTAREYRATHNYLQQWKQDTESSGHPFVAFLRRKKLSDNTIAKHVRQARTICKVTGLDYDGELALRAGATPLELMQHMDHANIRTTLLHYCRPTTTGLIKKLKVPIPDREGRMTPMFTEPELQNTLLDTMRSQLSKIGIAVDVVLDRFGLPVLPVAEIPVPKRSVRGEKSSGGKKGDSERPVLRVLWDDEEGGVA